LKRAPSFALAAPNPNDAHMAKSSNPFGLQLIHCGVIFCFLLFIGYELFLLIATIWSPDARSSVPRILIYSFFLLCYLAATHVVNLISERDGETGPRPDLRHVLAWGGALVKGLGRGIARVLPGNSGSANAEKAWPGEKGASANESVETPADAAPPGPLRLVSMAAAAAVRAWRAQWAQARSERRISDSAENSESLPSDAVRKSADPLAAFIRGLDKNGAQPASPPSSVPPQELEASVAPAIPEVPAVPVVPVVPVDERWVKEPAPAPFDFDAPGSSGPNSESALELTIKPSSIESGERQALSDDRDEDDATPLLGNEKSSDWSGAATVQLDATPGLKRARAPRRLLTLQPVTRVNSAFLRQSRKTRDKSPA
jgi:hypothetical protein